MNKQWLMAVLIGASACAGDGDKVHLPSADAGTQAAAPAPQVVTRATVTREAVSRAVRATGTTRPLRAANLASADSRRIEAILVKEGDAVKAGQALVRLDARAASLAVAQAQAQAAALHAQATRAASDYQRLAPLAEKGAVPQSRVDQLKSQRDAAQAQAAAADAATDSARRVAVDALLSAPFAGTVVEVPAEVGEMSGGKTLVRLIDLSTIEVAVRVSESDLARVAKGDAVRARFPGTGESAEGTVARVGMEVDPNTRTAEVVAELPNPERKLRAGLFAELDIATAARREVALIPRAALGGTIEDGFVYVLDGAKVTKRPVKVVAFDDTRLEVVEGLQGGETVAAANVDRLSDGVAVREEAPR